MSGMSSRSSGTGRPNLKDMCSLEQFKLPLNEAGPLYHDAVQLPAFLGQNLRARNRRVKQLSGDHALLTAFYYSLMRLAFDLEDGSHAALRARRILTTDEEFGAGELEDKTLSDAQYRQFLGEFMDLLEVEGPFEEAVQPYPIVDSILLKMFQRIVPVTLMLRDEDDQRVAERVLAFLAGKFGLSLQVVGGCFKLVEPDMFIYVQSLAEVYLVYVEALEGIREEEEEEVSEAVASISHRRSEISMRSGRTAKESIRVVGQKEQKAEKAEKVEKAEKAEKGKKFQTVINILESNNSMGSKSSAEKRSSYEGSLTKQAKIDSIKENFEEAPDYYGGAASFNSQKPATSSRSIKQAQQEPAASSQSLRSESSKISFPSNHLCQSSLSAHSAFSTPLHPSPPRPSDSAKLVRTYGGQGQGRQDFSKFSSQVYTQGKPSNLGIFSSVSPGGCAAQSEESVCDDSGYGKFTKSGVLDMLDEQFRQEIKMIKKKYRAERANLKNFF